MPQVPTDALHAALETVIDPEIRRPVTELGMVGALACDDDGRVAVTILLTVAACPLKETLTKDTTAALAGVEGVTAVEVTLGVMSDEQRGELKTKLRGGTAEREVPFAQPGSLTRVYAVASGKGGVGKSSVTANLAAALAQQGLSVGVVDADIYGFSIPRMLGVEHKPTQVDDMIMPPTSHGVRVISIGMFVPGNQPVVWRGPDAAPGPPAVPRRRLLGRPRRPPPRPAPGHRRHRHLGRPARPGRGDPRRHHAAAGRRRGGRAGRARSPCRPTSGSPGSSRT